MKKSLILGMAGILFLVSCGAKEKASSSCDVCHGSVISESSAIEEPTVSSVSEASQASSSSIAQSSAGSFTLFSSVEESKASSTVAASTSDAGETTTSSDEGSWLSWV